jgi:hypothetical protein
MFKSKVTTIIAVTGLVIAVFGSTPLGQAASGLVRHKNSVGRAQIKNGAVSGKKIAKDAVTSVKVKDGSLVSADFKAGQIPVGPTGPKGDKGEPGANGTATAYALINANATVDPATAKNITSANVMTVNGAYCIHDLGFTPKNVIATLASPPVNSDLHIEAALGPGPCLPGAQIRVFIHTGAGAFMGSAFFLSLN